MLGFFNVTNWRGNSQRERRDVNKTCRRRGQFSQNAVLDRRAFRSDLCFSSESGGVDFLRFAPFVASPQQKEKIERALLQVVTLMQDVLGPKNCLVGRSAGQCLMVF